MKLVSEITQIKYFDQNLETCGVCDASTCGLEIALEQHTTEGCVAIASSQFFKFP